MTALNFPDSPSNGDTYQGYTYNSTKGTWAKSAVADARTAVYANIEALPTSGTAGDMAYVTATNRLYIWTGTGWYNIALINNNPTISGVNATYNLAIDGTATTVTITATDPEGLPITYSIASDTSGNTATVAQGTGANTNVFTITPSTNTAHAGTFSLTFRASDGVNIASAAASFTLVFNIQNQKYTTALITSVGANNATNSSNPDDKSTNNHTISRYGNTHQTTFSPYRHGGYSVYFDGSGDNLGFASLSALNVNTYMSLECWVKLDDKNNANELIVGRDSGYWLMYDWPALGVAQDKFGFGANFGGSWSGVSSTTSPESGVWYHVVGVREDTTYKIYVNGTLENTATISGTPSNGGVVGIAANTNQLGGALKGYLADVRVVISANSSSLPYTANFTPPEERLTAITDTQLLACHLPYMKEGSTHGHTITVNGNTKTEPFGPYDTQEYAAADHGGSFYFDGNGDYLSTDSTNTLDLDGNFTIEGWFRQDGSAGTTNYPSIISSTTWNNSVSFSLRFNNTGNAKKFQVAKHGYNNAGTNNIIVGSKTYPYDTWNHFALVRTGASGNQTVTLYVNGESNGSASDNASYNLSYNNAGAKIGGNNWDGANSYIRGNLADLRVVKGTAVYTAEFTPPTSPLTAVTNTQLLLQGIDGAIIDKSQSAKKVSLNGDVKSSTAQTKYLSSSMYFDGSGDYIDTHFPALGTADFTIEFWFWASSINSTYQALFENRSSTNTANPLIWIKNSNVIYFYAGSERILGTTTVTASTWHHVALVRNAGVFTLYLDGSSEGTYTGTLNFPADTMRLGQRYTGTAYNFTGYMSDIRITTGLARYTSNFTAPTAALKG